MFADAVWVDWLFEEGTEVDVEGFAVEGRDVVTGKARRGLRHWGEAACVVQEMVGGGIIAGIMKARRHLASEGFLQLF